MKYTPEIIVQQNLKFSVPIYQRLFEWNKDNVHQLLTDLKNAYIDSANQDYYIGMLTVTTSNDRMQLVDGQQRFTVLTLLGCVLQTYENNNSIWRDFLLCGEKPRLYFDARRKDNAYLEHIIESREDTSVTVNQKMEDAIDEITEFIEHNEQLKNQLSEFSRYLYQHISFFIAELPPNYHAQDLNKYFERMNSGGKNLEQHEILKVKMLRNLGSDVNAYMQLWNKIADVDTLFFREDDANKLLEQKNSALSITLDTLPSKISELICVKSDDDIRTIGEIEPSSQKPKQENRIDITSRCVLRFPYLLLQTLYYYLYLSKRGTEIQRIDEFFNPGNLLETFQTYLPFEGEKVDKENLRQFILLLLRSRIVMDICFIRTSEYGYTLDMGCSEEEKERKNLLMFESFLYVSSSNYTNYRWFGWLMNYMDGKTSVPTPNDLFCYLIKQCDAANPLPEEKNLCYGKDIRYWFWRLDFYLWQQRKELFQKDSDAEYLKIAENYVFSRNRSIEHIAPQHPKTESMLQWEGDSDTEVMNSFGNLVMISQGLNSALSNSSYEEKIAHVESYFKSVTGSIESLKLLMVCKDYKNGWTKDTIKEHGEKMYLFLKKALNESHGEVEKVVHS